MNRQQIEDRLHFLFLQLRVITIDAFIMYNHYNNKSIDIFDFDSIIKIPKIEIAPPIFFEISISAELYYENYQITFDSINMEFLQPHIFEEILGYYEENDEKIQLSCQINSHPFYKKNILRNFKNKNKLIIRTKSTVSNNIYETKPFSILDITDKVIPTQVVRLFKVN